MNSSRLLKVLSIGARLLSIAVTGVLWHVTYKYIYRKINIDCEDEFKNNDDYSDCYKTIRMKIPSYSKGGIIGKNGSTIKRIQEKTKTTIKFLNKNIPTIDNSEIKQSDWNVDITNDNENSFDMILIRGLTLRVMEAEKEIKNVIAAIPVYNEEFMIVDNRFIGKIIGKKGENIKRLKDCYKVQIDIDKSDSPQRTITIRGITENISECRRDIVKIIDIMIKEGKLSNEDHLRFKTTVFHENISEKYENYEPVPKNQYIKYPGALNEKIDIYVSSVVDCSKFYAHVVNSNLKALTNLIDEMTDYFSNTTDVNREVFNVGDILAGYFETSYTWQRVQIVSIKNDSFEVVFLDYGDTAFLKATELQTFKNRKDFLNLPFQALQLVTYGIKPINDVWSNNDITYFESLTKVGDYYKLTAILRRQDTMDFEVQLFDVNGIDIGLQLINKGIAKSKL